MLSRLGILLAVLAILPHGVANAQSFGIELLNNVMPASGGMGGASIAMPQDLQSAINGNPATLTQYRGTQFGFGSAWIEATSNLSVAAPGIPSLGIDPFTNAKSDAQGVAAGNIGVTQDVSALGMPMTIGLGLIAGSGAGNDFRHIPESNGTHTTLVALDIVMSAAVDMTDRWSLGSSLVMTNATLDGPFVGVTGSSSDYALRGVVGINYELDPETNAGFFYKTKSNFTFQNLAGFDPPGPGPLTFLDVAVDRPQIFGVGIANTSLMEGRLLLAVDAVYLAYTDTDLFGAVYKDQWAVQVGAQYSPNDRVRMRVGYAWNENPMRDLVGDNAGGIVPPGGTDHIQYVQALFAAIPQHRVTGGMSIRDVLPGIDMDFYAGGMFENTETFGVTTAKLQTYWVGTGFTWRFGRGACEHGEWQY